MSSVFVLLLVELPRWLFLATLFYAPWAYGGTHPEAIRVLNALLGLILALWLCSRLLRLSPEHRATASPIRLRPVAAACVGILLAVGWWMVFNAHLYYDPLLARFFPAQPIARFLPGSVDGPVSAEAMVRLSMLLGALLFVSDLARRPSWRMRLWRALALAGVSIAVLGISFKLGFDHSWLWNEGNYRWNNFGPFRYHANAAAFLNLTLPIVATLALRSFRSRATDLQRALWAPSTLLVLAAAAVNPSRAGQVITVALCLPLGWFATVRALAATAGWARVGVLVCAAALVVALAVLVSAVGWQRSRIRWDEFGSVEFSTNTRVLASATCISMIGRNGPLGFGPGTFTISFPLFTHQLGDKLIGWWRYAHEDYLQTAVEWGVAAIPWAILLFGGIFLTVPALWAQLRTLSPEVEHGSRTGGAPASRHRLLYAGTALALLGVAVHAAVDFPLQIASIQLFTVTLLGIAWAPEETHHTAPGAHR